MSSNIARVRTDAPEVEVPVVETPAQELPATEPVIEAPVVEAPAPVQQRYEYQPTDEQGRPIGGKQVILYADPNQLAEKLRDQNILLVRKLREESRLRRLGVSGDAPFAEGEVEQFDQPIEFKKRELTPEEMFQITQDLNDPTKFQDARDRFFEASVGAKPDKLAEALNKTQRRTLELEARANAQTFIGQHPEFYACTENLETLTDWMLKNRLTPTLKNFDAAYQRLQGIGLFLEAPIVREVAPPVAPVAAVENTTANSQPSADPESRITTQEPPQAKRQARIPSGLNARVASPAGEASNVGNFDLAAVERMSADQFKQRYNTDAVFRAAYEKAARESAQRKREAANR